MLNWNVKVKVIKQFVQNTSNKVSLSLDDQESLLVYDLLFLSFAYTNFLPPPTLRLKKCRRLWTRSRRR